MNNKAQSAILATRGSALALWQAKFIAAQLQQHGLETNLKIVKTTGDIVQDRFLSEIGGKGLFIKELEEAMLAGQADLAMHSLKDLPVNIPQGFKLIAILKRHSVFDAIIFRKDLYSKLGLVPGKTLDQRDIQSLGPLKIATSSLRRQALFAELNTGIKIEPIRGNVDTRIRKIDELGFDAIILAEASLIRLGLTHLNYHRLDSQWFVPCAGQGAIAVETPVNSQFEPILSKLNCKETALMVNIERTVLKALGGDCTMPFGCLVEKDPRDSSQLKGLAIVMTPQGEFVKSCQTSLINDQDVNGSTLTFKIIEDLKKNGANDILEKLGITARL
jgi:hydroxymethylbilane synthase